VTDQVTFDRTGALAGFRACIPIALGLVPFGFVFGVLARQTGLSVLETGLMSAFVLAGGAQFVAIELWQTPLPSLTIILTTLVVNLRHIFMGAALRPWFSNLGPAKTYGSAFFLIDENRNASFQQAAPPQVLRDRGVD
jgi:4-azaleucine resistance transporter AzlC